jgi:hypothetical protein
MLLNIITGELRENRWTNISAHVTEEKCSPVQQFGPTPEGKKPNEEPWSRLYINTRVGTGVPHKGVHTKHDGLLPNSSQFIEHKHPEIHQLTLDNVIHSDSVVR